MVKRRGNAHCGLDMQFYQLTQEVNEIVHQFKA
jgi:hypothetical protein